MQLEHWENMECVAEEVQEMYHVGQKQLLCYRGVKREQIIFDDEKKLQDFLSFNEEAYILQ